MTILVDTSVWVGHLRRGNEQLAVHLGRGMVVCHRYVIGELACENLHNRARTLQLLRALVEAPLAEQQEVLGLVEGERLYGRGLGWIDAHLLASALLLGCPLWTADRALSAAADQLGVAFEPII